MKTKLLLTLFLSLMMASGYSHVEDDDTINVELTLFIVKKDGQTGNGPKSPTLSVFIHAHTLHFYNVEEDYTLSLYDDAGMLVYSDTITPSTTYLSLPLYLTGNFTLRLGTSSLYYLGHLDL